MTIKFGYEDVEMALIFHQGHPTKRPRDHSIISGSFDELRVTNKDRKTTSA